MPLHALADLSNATAASQAEMEAGTETALRVMSPLRVSQAIAALGGGSGGTWGSITGTLSAQTDLQTVLDEKVSSDPTGVTGADAITNIISLTQAEYDAIGSPSATTYYIITDAAAGTLAQFDATTSAQLAGVISDETGTGALVFANSPTLVTPALGTPSALTLTNATGLPVGGITATGTPSGTTYLRGDGAWATPAGGGSGDIVSDLVSAEISVTGATTATISRMHVCSGTTSDFTLTLPAASGNAGKMIGVRMADGLTKLVTIDANSTELIDGLQTRIMWAGESAILLCDGTGWAKISGKSRPMVADSRRNTSLTITNATATHVSLNNDQTSSVAAMIASGSLVALRPGKYAIDGLVTYEASGANPGFESYCIASINDNVYTGFAGVARLSVVPTSTNTTDTYAHPAVSSSLTLAAGDTVSLVAYQNTGGSMTTRTAIQGVYPYLRITESPDW